MHPVSGSAFEQQQENNGMVSYEYMVAPSMMVYEGDILMKQQVEAEAEAQTQTYYNHHVIYYNKFYPEIQVELTSEPYLKNSKAKPRLRWTDELQERFLHSVYALGGEKEATPKKILVMMNVKGLTLNHLKSHLQKYRLAIKKEDGPLQPPSPSPIPVPVNLKKRSSPCTSSSGSPVGPSSSKKKSAGANKWEAESSKAQKQDGNKPIIIQEEVDMGRDEGNQVIEASTYGGRKGKEKEEDAMLPPLCDCKVGWNNISPAFQYDSNLLSVYGGSMFPTGRSSSLFPMVIDHLMQPPPPPPAGFSPIVINSSMESCSNFSSKVANLVGEPPASTLTHHHSMNNATSSNVSSDLMLVASDPMEPSSSFSSTLMGMDPDLYFSLAFDNVSLDNIASIFPPTPTFDNTTMAAGSASASAAGTLGNSTGTSSSNLDENGFISGDSELDLDELLLDTPYE